MNYLIFGLLFFNTAFNVTIACMYVRNVWNWQVAFQRSFWMKRIEGIYIMRWERPLGEVPNEGNTIWSWKFRKSRDDDYERHCATLPQRAAHQ